MTWENEDAAAWTAVRGRLAERGIDPDGEAARGHSVLVGLRANANATQAALRAGYSRKTARKIGQENLTKLDIATLLREVPGGVVTFTPPARVMRSRTRSRCSPRRAGWSSGSRRFALRTRSHNRI